ncbi:hypothetical protein DXK94_17385 [Arthrobacter sp. RT-1]|uniref:hypothetical protein n=1 Tax=Arthrobacter sp. RT-1 TaxID=2292263 RepID=UPI000E1F07F3|nr:hypothetical protein [Arthrobacter sp. RT-1]RDV08687.1 hypothetical protein DXK94_17385 [Arthrobacter sp. RT-1]
MKLIWATRGRMWGFRFLRDGGFPDPLVEYDKAFSDTEGEPEVCRRIGEVVALRFPDPRSRQDRAGRIIQHDFVVFPPLATAVGSVGDGIRDVWPLVAEQYEEAWNLPKPPLIR